MNFDEALRRYRADRFTDGDIVGGTGLSVRTWRELIERKAVHTIEERRGPGRGRIRLCDAVVFKRAAIISALNSAGFSTVMSGQIAYFIPFHTLLYAVCDPLMVLFEHSVDVDPKTGLPPRRALPARDWFDPDCPATPEPASDWLIEVYDGQFVACIYGAETASTPIMFGDLRNARTAFVAWSPSHEHSKVIGSPIARLAEQLLPYHKLTDFVADWENPDKFPRELKRLGYEYEKHPADAPLRVMGQSAARNFTFKMTVNITLAIRKALRRYLELEPAIAPAK